MPQMDLVDVVCPIDEEAAPDHGGQDGEVDPVHPADGEGMFGDGFFYAGSSGGKLRILSNFIYHRFITFFWRDNLCLPITLRSRGGICFVIRCSVRSTLWGCRFRSPS